MGARAVGVSKPKALLSWSSGKDSVFALAVLRAEAEVEVVGLVTTVTTGFERVAMHGVRQKLLELQAAAVELPVRVVNIPSPCSNEQYDVVMAEVVTTARAEGVTRMAFGDLFLSDIRAYREQRLAGTGVQPMFPLWGRDTRSLAGEMVRAGVRATLACVDPRQLDRGFAGRQFDRALLRELPAGVDPCGENGEFHTFAWDGPGFRRPVPVAAGETVERDGFVFTDLLPAV